VSSKTMTPVQQGVPALPSEVLGFPTTAVIVLHTQSEDGEFMLVHDTAAITDGNTLTDYAKLPNGSIVVSDADAKIYVKKGTIGLLNGTGGYAGLT
jgi:hypothetical protein